MEKKRIAIDQLLGNRGLTHGLFWIMLYLATAYQNSLVTANWKEPFIHNLALLPSQIIAAYFLVYYQIPQLLYKKKYAQFLISFILVAIGVCLLGRILLIYCAEPFTRINFYQESIYEIIMDPMHLIKVYFPWIYLYSILLLIVKTFKDHYHVQNQLDILQKEKARTELKFLKAQIHPHFLFNTLNNLYALTLEKSDAAPEVVVKLSEMLDYMLYQCSDPKVAIRKELELIHNYIDLEKLRYGDHLSLTLKEEIDQPETPIAPLILLSIIENAFKHGASNNLDKPIIDISIKVIKQKLIFTVFNTKPSHSIHKEKKRKGMGSINIKRQLNLIYPDKHLLKIEDKPDSYLVNLEIQL